VRLEEFRGVLDVHGEHFTDAEVAPAYRQRLGIEAAATAAVAGHLDVRQEAHFHGLYALTFAGLRSVRRRY
jgi:ribosomal protein S18 acetylase RimI-like enzyme